jgi:hypothetical protein
MVLVDSSAWIEGLRRKGSLEVKLALEGLLEALRDGDRVYSIDHHFQEIARIVGILLYTPGYGGTYQP